MIFLTEVGFQKFQIFEYNITGQSVGKYKKMKHFATLRKELK